MRLSEFEFIRDKAFEHINLDHFDEDSKAQVVGLIDCLNRSIMEKSIPIQIVESLEAAFVGYASLHYELCHVEEEADEEIIFVKEMLVSGCLDLLVTSLENNLPTSIMFQKRLMEMPEWKHFNKYLTGHLFFSMLSDEEKLTLKSSFDLNKNPKAFLGSRYANCKVINMMIASRDSYKIHEIFDNFQKDECKIVYGEKTIKVKPVTWETGYVGEFDKKRREIIVGLRTDEFVKILLQYDDIFSISYHDDHDDTDKIQVGTKKELQLFFEKLGIPRIAHFADYLPNYLIDITKEDALEYLSYKTHAFQPDFCENLYNDIVDLYERLATHNQATATKNNEWKELYEYVIQTLLHHFQPANETPVQTEATFFSCILITDKKEEILKQLHVWVDAQKKPKAKLMGIRAAMEAKIIKRPSFEECVSEFPDISKSSWQRYTDQQRKISDLFIENEINILINQYKSFLA